MRGKAPPRSALEDSPAVRHRRAVGWNDIVVASRESSGGGAGAAIGGLFAGPSGPAPAQVLQSAGPKEPEKLVIEAWLDLEVDNVGATATAIRARVEASGGRVVSENVEGAGDKASSAAMELRVPPAHATDVVTWLGTLGVLESKRVVASDVSKTLHDQELELKNLEVTMARLMKLAEASGPVNDLLAIEKEMTRVRGEIERVKGEQRWLLDRVDFATISVTLKREGGPVELSPSARMFPGPHGSMLVLINPGMRQRTRFGGGVTVHVKRFATFDLDVYPRADGDGRAITATFGTAMYSGYLGYGRRQFLNPYVGARMGYGYLSDAGGFLLAGELGVELYKHRYLLVETSVRALAFLREEGNEAAIHALAGFSVPF